MSVYKTIVATAKQADSGTIHAVASTPAIVRMGDVVEQDFDLTEFKKNPIIVHNHDYAGPVIGKATDIGFKDGNLVMSVQFDEHDTNPLGQRIANQYRTKYMSAFSVGFSPGKVVPRNKLDKDHPAYSAKAVGSYMSESTLLEVSAVSIPANPEALAIRALQWGLKPEQKHVVSVEEDDDFWTVTYAKHEDEEAEEVEEVEEVEEEPTEDAPEQEALAYGDDDDEEKALRAVIREELIAILGRSDALMMKAMEEDHQTVAPRCGVAALFEVGE